MSEPKRRTGMLWFLVFIAFLAVALTVAIEAKKSAREKCERGGGTVVNVSGGQGFICEKKGD